MEEGGLRGATKSAVGSVLAGRAGELCLRTRCQDIVPKCISGPCADAARGRSARRLCRPLLAECQENSAEIAGCASRCARYFDKKDVPACEKDCNRVRCRVYEPYERCVATNTLVDMLNCFENNCRTGAVDCLAARCKLDSSDVSLAKATISAKGSQQ